MMIIRLSLLLVICAVLVFFVAEVSAPLSFLFSTVNLAQLGSGILLSAFALLIIKGSWGICLAVIHSVAEYFSCQQRRSRRLAFIQSKQDQINRLFFFKTLQIRYWTGQKIKQLLNKNNEEQLQSLSKAIQNDLLQLKKTIPGPAFKQLQSENKRYRGQRDIEALLKLQQKISTLV
jgi:hypothetical protein